MDNLEQTQQVLLRNTSQAALRGFEAWLYLSGARGLVSLVCVFTQWARRLAYPEGDGMAGFDFMGK